MAPLTGSASPFTSPPPGLHQSRGQLWKGGKKAEKSLTERENRQVQPSARWVAAGEEGLGSGLRQGDAGARWGHPAQPPVPAPGADGLGERRPRELGDSNAVGTYSICQASACLIRGVSSPPLPLGVGRGDWYPSPGGQRWVCAAALARAGARPEESCFLPTPSLGKLPWANGVPAAGGAGRRTPNVQRHQRAGGTPRGGTGRAAGLATGSLSPISLDFGSAAMTSPRHADCSFLRFAVPGAAEGCRGRRARASSRSTQPAPRLPPLPPLPPSSRPKVFRTRPSPAPTTFSHDPTLPPLCTSLPKLSQQLPVAAPQSQGSLPSPPGPRSCPTLDAAPGWMRRGKAPRFLHVPRLLMESSGGLRGW